MRITARSVEVGAGRLPTDRWADDRRASRPTALRVAGQDPMFTFRQPVFTWQAMEQIDGPPRRYPMASTQRTRSQASTCGSSVTFAMLAAGCVRQRSMHTRRSWLARGGHAERYGSHCHEHAGRPVPGCWLFGSTAEAVLATTSVHSVTGASLAARRARRVVPE